MYTSIIFPQRFHEWVIIIFSNMILSTVLAIPVTILCFVPPQVIHSHPPAIYHSVIFRCSLAFMAFYVRAHVALFLDLLICSDLSFV